MPHIIVGLGNPGQEYENTRHNAGRSILDYFRKEHLGDFTFDKKLEALKAEGKIGKGKKTEKVILIAPETFMNNSGKTVVKLVASSGAAEKLIVIYDDFSLPLGRIKISFNRSSGGHNGLESIIKSLKTEKFTRVRIGTALVNAKGVAKVPHGDDKIEKFILGKFKPDELKTLKKVSKIADEAVYMIINEGREKAMSVFNAN